MSEAVTDIGGDDREPTFDSFAERVWSTFQLIDISEHVQQKGKLDYLSWANAWRFVMQTFPESSFKFDELKVYGNGTAEQWVEVTIKQGEQSHSMRWWLPVLNYKNAPVDNPNAQQINNTRMRVLVKCLAMLGLGTELYAGEDIPDKENDQKTVHGGSSVVAAVLADVTVNWDDVNGHVATIKACMFNQDDDGLLDAIDRLATDNDMKVAVWSKLDSKTRAHIKKLTKPLSGDKDE